MNNYLKYFGFFSIIIGALIYTLQKLNIPLPKIINNYLNDFLIVPIILFLSLLFLRWSRHEKDLYLSLPIVVYISVIYSVLFELVLPNYLIRYTGDIWDVLVYFLGGIAFYLLQNKSKKKLKLL